MAEVEGNEKIEMQYLKSEFYYLKNTINFFKNYSSIK